MSWHKYTYTTPAKGWIMVAAFVASIGAVLSAVYQLYPDMPVYPREYDKGLVQALGGSESIRVSLLSSTILSETSKSLFQLTSS